MASTMKLKNEEYTTLGDFVLTSFDRDLPIIAERFPKMDNAFKDSFVAKLLEVKTLESGLLLTDAQKNVTQSLYTEAGEVKTELNYLTNYCKDANLNTGIVQDLKKDLAKGNIEGAVLKIEGVKQFVIANAPVLIAEGMPVDFATTLDTHKDSLADKNALQNSVMNTRKILTEANKAQYKELYDYISKIMRYGKLVFKDSVIKDEYTSSKVIKKMRAANN